MIQRIRDAVAWRWWYIRTLLVRGVIARILTFPHVFAHWSAAIAYTRAMLSTKSSTEPACIHVRALGGKPLYCRPGTSDPWVVWDVFASEFQQLPREIESPRTIVDLGANVGYTPAWYAAHYPAARIIAVEMDATNFALAKRNLEPFSQRCILVNAAVWDADGELEYDGSEQQGFRVAALDPAQAAVRRRRVVSRSLDSLFDEHGLDEVDFLKMDIEGAESAVFAGSLAWLDRVRSLKIEVHPPMTLAECRRVLESRGFTCRCDDRHDHGLVAIRTEASESKCSEQTSVAAAC